MIKLLLPLILLSNLAIGQVDFKWDIKDSIPKSKNTIYSDTKLFIAEYWKSAQNVVQSDDKEAGVILIKAVTIQNKFFMLNDHTMIFGYTAKFMIKDNKYRLTLNNVYCESSICQQNNWPKMPVSETYPESNGLTITGVGKKNYLEIMSTLRADLQAIVSSYNSYIMKPSEVKSEW